MGSTGARNAQGGGLWALEGGPYTRTGPVMKLLLPPLAIRLFGQGAQE